jgi:hypothetical protein
MEFYSVLLLGKVHYVYWIFPNGFIELLFEKTQRNFNRRRGDDRLLFYCLSYGLVANHLNGILLSLNFDILDSG